MPQNAEPIKGKIASIVTPQNVFINRGEQDGVKKWMLFTVKLRIGRIEDPDDPTNTLEELSFTKAKIKVTTVYDRMSYCMIEGTRDISPLAKEIASITGVVYPKVRDLPLISESDWHLRRGDEVEEIVPADEEEPAAKED